MTYRSAVDWWFYVVVFGVAIATIPTMVPLFASGQPIQVLIAVFTLLLACGLPLWLLASTYYRIDASALIVRSGPFRWTVPLSEIRSVRPSRSLLSSPALSLDRIRIDYGRGRSLMVSPRDREGFLAAIQRRMSPDSARPSGVTSTPG